MTCPLSLVGNRYASTRWDFFQFPETPPSNPFSAVIPKSSGRKGGRHVWGAGGDNMATKLNGTTPFNSPWVLKGVEDHLAPLFDPSPRLDLVMIFNWRWWGSAEVSGLLLNRSGLGLFAIVWISDGSVGKLFRARDPTEGWTNYWVVRGVVCHFMRCDKGKRTKRVPFNALHTSIKRVECSKKKKIQKQLNKIYKNFYEIDIQRKFLIIYQI